MFIIGLTGGIASGKSTVASMLAEKGALLLDADVMAREVVLPGKPAWREIRAWLGSAIIAADGTIDRARLGKLIFADASARQRLEEIIHPRVAELFAGRLEEIVKDDPHAVIVYDVPLLIESNMDRLVDMVALVYVSEEIQLARLQERNGLTVAEALARVRAQMPIAAKRELAHVIFDNSGSLAETRRQVNAFWEGLRESGRI